MNTVASNVAALVTLGFPSALVLADSDKRFYNLFAATVVMAIVFTLAFGAVFIGLLDVVLPFALGDDTLHYGGLIVISTLMLALTQVFPNLNIWRNRFKASASVNVLVNGSARGLSLGIGFLSPGYAFGLIIGEVGGRVIGLATYGFGVLRREWRTMVKQVTLSGMQDALRAFSRYPKYMLTGNYVATFTTHLPLLIFPYFFDASLLGNYSLAVGLVNIPSILLAHPLSTVFLKRFIELQERSAAELPAFMTRTVYGLFSFAVIPFALVTVLGEELFPLVFGEAWRYAGLIASILSVSALVEVLQISVQGVLQAHKLEPLIFRFRVVQLGLAIVLMLPGLYLRDAIAMIGGFTLARVISGSMVLHKVMAMSHLRPGVVLARFACVFAGLVFFFFLVKSLWIVAW